MFSAFRRFGRCCGSIYLVAEHSSLYQMQSCNASIQTARVDNCCHGYEFILAPVKYIKTRLVSYISWMGCYLAFSYGVYSLCSREIANNMVLIPFEFAAVSPSVVTSVHEFASLPLYSRLLTDKRVVLLGIYTPSTMTSCFWCFCGQRPLYTPGLCIRSCNEKHPFLLVGSECSLFNCVEAGCWVWPFGNCRMSCLHILLLLQSIPGRHPFLQCHWPFSAAIQYFLEVTGFPECNEWVQQLYPAHALMWGRQLGFTEWFGPLICGVIIFRTDVFQLCYSRHTPRAILVW